MGISAAAVRWMNWDVECGEATTTRLTRRDRRDINLVALSISLPGKSGENCGYIVKDDRLGTTKSKVCREKDGAITDALRSTFIMENVQFLSCGIKLIHREETYVYFPVMLRP